MPAFFDFASAVVRAVLWDLSCFDTVGEYVGATVVFADFLCHWSSLVVGVVELVAVV